MKKSNDFPLVVKPGDLLLALRLAGLQTIAVNFHNQYCWQKDFAFLSSLQVAFLTSLPGARSGEVWSWSSSSVLMWEKLSSIAIESIEYSCKSMEPESGS